MLEAGLLGTCPRRANEMGRWHDSPPILQATWPASLSDEEMMLVEKENTCCALCKNTGAPVCIQLV